MEWVDEPKAGKSDSQVSGLSHQKYTRRSLSRKSQKNKGLSKERKIKKDCSSLREDRKRKPSRTRERRFARRSCDTKHRRRPPPPQSLDIFSRLTQGDPDSWGRSVSSRTQSLPSFSTSPVPPLPVATNSRGVVQTSHFYAFCFYCLLSL